jgi:hypothetical protein
MVRVKTTLLCSNQTRSARFSFPRRARPGLVLAGACLFAVGPAALTTLPGIVVTSHIITAYDSGWYNSLGQHDPANRSLLTGNLDGVRYASWASFHLPAVDRADYASTSTSSTTTTRYRGGTWIRRPELDKPFDPLDPTAPAAPFAWERVVDYVDFTRTATTMASSTFLGFSTAILSYSNAGVSSVPGGVLRFWDIDTALAELQAGGTGRVDIHQDLVGGLSFGAVWAPAAGGFSATLNDAALAALFAASDGVFALGAELVGAAPGEYLLGGPPKTVTLQFRDLREDSTQTTYTETFHNARSVTERLLYWPSPIVIPEPGSTAATVATLLLGCAAFRRFACGKWGSPHPDER